jgi:hypothetical protein
MLHVRTLSGTVEVDGRAYAWRLEREPQWCTVDGWRGMLVAVVAEAGGREALLQFPRARRPGQRARGYRHRPQIHRSDLESAIRTARAAGWDPDSRGKPFQIEL